MKKIALFLVSICILEISAQNRDTLFADYLFQKGYYQFALVEYERLLYKYPDSITNWEFRIGLCNFYQNQFEQALAQLKNMKSSDKANSDSVNLYAGISALRLNYIDKASSYLEASSIEESSIYKSYISFVKNDHKKAKSQISHIPDSSVNSFKAQGLKQVFDDASTVSKKHYAPAFLLSLIPGLGHVYTGRYGDAAMTAMTVTTGALITSYYAYHKSYGRAYTTGTITGLFYAGGIYGALMSVKIYNRNASNQLQKRAFRIVFGQ